MASFLTSLTLIINSLHKVKFWLKHFSVDPQGPSLFVKTLYFLLLTCPERPQSPSSVLMLSCLCKCRDANPAHWSTGMSSHCDRPGVAAASRAETSGPGGTFTSSHDISLLVVNCAALTSLNSWHCVPVQALHTVKTIYMVQCRHERTKQIILSITVLTVVNLLNSIVSLPHKENK